MKRALLLAALAALPLSTLSAKADTGSGDPNMSGETTRMFIINATTPGALTFSGAGTATFNNQVGTSNQFNVGSTTSLGVNASISATPEFDAAAQGLMQLAGTSTLMQTNGTAASAANTQAASMAAHDVASTAAHTQAYEAAWAGNSSWESGWESEGTYGSNGEWQWNDDSTHSAKAEWEQTYNSAYTNSYNTTFSDVVTASTSAQSEESKQGIISGRFQTIETTVSGLSQSSAMADIAAMASAAASADYEVGSADWEAAYRVAFASGYQAANANVNSTSTSTVTVEGLGAIATVNASDQSKFDVDLSRLSSYTALDTQDNSTATANGSAAASLSTNSFATQNNNRTASAFMQAFAAAPVPNKVVLDEVNGGGAVYNQQLLGTFGSDGVITNDGAGDGGGAGAEG